MTDRDRLDEGGERRESAEWLTSALDAESRRYEPDELLIRAMISQRLDGSIDEAAHVPRVRSGGRGPVVGFRLTGIPAGIAAAALCAAIAVAVTATVAAHPHANSAASAGGSARPRPTASVSPSSTPTRAAVDRAQSAVTIGAPAAPTTKSALVGRAAMPAKAPTPRPANTGPIILTAVGRVAVDSNAYWTEEDVLVTLTEPINTLQLTVRIAPSPGLSGAQPWSNHNTSTFDMSVSSSAEGLFYDFKLKPGASVPAGQIEFAVQFGHRSSPHDMSGDTYSLSVTTDAAHGSVSGASAGGF